MGFYIEELPTELNGITMKEAVYWADIYLQDNPCDRMWDAMRALRDFYETVTSEAVEEADRKTEPTFKVDGIGDDDPTIHAIAYLQKVGWLQEHDRALTEPQTDWHYDEQDATWYPYKHEDEPQTEREGD